MEQYLQILLELEKYYCNLLIVQYNGKPKAVATIKMMVDLLWVNMILMQIRDGFDWRTAVGPQLDIVGAWVGVDRFYNGQLFDFRPWFALIDWNKEPDNLQGGFSTYQNFDTLEGGFLDYNVILPTKNKMIDSAFRIMIGLKIIKNNINATAKNIDDAIWDYFEGDVYTVWEPFKLIYYYPSTLTEVMQVALEKDVLPVPTGCQIELREIIND